MVGEIAAGYTSLKAAYEIARGLKDISDRVALNAAVIDLQERILSAQESVANTRDQIKDLKAQLEEFEAWDVVASRYALTDFGDETYAYALISSEQNTEPPHLACPNCFQARRKSILQCILPARGGGKKTYRCVHCDKQFHLGKSLPKPIQRPQGNFL